LHFAGEQRVVIGASARQLVLRHTPGDAHGDRGFLVVAGGEYLVLAVQLDFEATHGKQSAGAADNSE
jgi:hypothetical protein